MRLVQVVRRADGDVVQRRAGLATQSPGMVIEALELGEKLALGRDAVDDAHGIIDVIGRHQLVAGIPDGRHVAGRNVAGRADQCESLHDSAPRMLRP
ncbi:hypothetical protein D3C72_1901710 [compost metagenome]